MNKLYKVYTTTNCPLCESLKKMVTVKSFDNHIDYINSTEDDIEFLKEQGQRRFPAIYDNTTGTFIDLQTFFTNMEQLCQTV